MLLLVLHSGAFPEETVAESVCVLPTVIETEDEESLIFGCFTVMVQVLDTPSTFAVILVVPCLTAVTNPFSSTVATLLLPDFQTGE